MFGLTTPGVYLCAAAVLAAPAACAQAAAPTLGTLEQTVKDRTTEWQKLAQNLEPTLNRLLPCDSKVAASITEVSKASEARVAALAAYLGVRVHIRQIRLIASRAWAQEGRVSIQASHRLHS